MRWWRYCRRWVIGLSVAVLVLTASVLTNDTVAAAHAPETPASCPAASPPGPAYIGMLVAYVKLVPFTPQHVLLCRYNGLNPPAAAYALTASARVDGAPAAKLAATANASVVTAPRGSVACPAADGSSVDAYFWNSADRILVRFFTSGCQTADNGAQTGAWIGTVDIGEELDRLIP